MTSPSPRTALDDRQAFLLGRLIWLAICAAVVLVYLPGLHAPFVYDDKIEVVGNATIRDLGQWRAIVGYNVSRLLLVTTYAWNYQLWGLDPTGYHLVTLGIHLLGIAAAMWLAEGIGRLADIDRPIRTGGVAVAAWALHPMTTEAVTYTTGRSESLCGLFCFSALGAWAWAMLARRQGNLRATRWLRLVAFTATIAALLSKEVGAMVPAALLAMELLLGRQGEGHPKESLATRALWSIPFLVLLIAAAWARLEFAGELLPREVDRPLGTQLLTQTAVWLRYVQLWVLPVGQTLFHHQTDLSPQQLSSWAWFAGWLTMLGAAAWWSRSRPAVAWALVAGALFLVPSSSVVPLKENMAEHRAYVLGLYLYLALVWSLTPRHLPRSVVALVLILLSVATVQRNRVWASETALWQEATRHNPEVAEAWYGLGDALRFEGHFDQAAEAYEQCLELDESYLDAWNNLGIARAETGDDAGARQAWRSALRHGPSYCSAHNNLGFMAYRQQEWNEALTELRTSLAYCPRDVVAHYGLGNIYAGPRFDRTRAIHHFESALEIDPDFDKAAAIRERLLELTW
ncbi:MAG: tetratricopeptide repeat protein [Myxococcota bacterium]|jgi:tetratricopeptide (TPR) repeat protein|nr:tetratricopeptide repeat protein [Myxococcota bacterium]